MHESKRFDDLSIGVARETTIRGDPENHLWHNRRVRNLGQPGNHIAGEVGAVNLRGNPKPHGQPS
jgi:hypothetical protein